MEVSQPRRIVQTYGVAERAVIGLDHLLAPHHGIVDGKVRPVVQQGFDLSWEK